MGPWARVQGSLKPCTMADDGVGGFAAAFEGAFAQLLVVGGGSSGGDGGEGGECRSFEVEREELATRSKELVDTREELRVVADPLCEGGEAHVHALGDVGKPALLKERGEDRIGVGVRGGVGCVREFHARVVQHARWFEKVSGRGFGSKRAQTW